MRFKRVDKSTVRCIVSQDEIEERGLKIEDLIRNGDKAQEFLNEVVDMAEEEIGFKLTSGIQAVQAAFLPNHDVVFTFSDNVENMGMDRALDQLKDMISEDGMFPADRMDEIRNLKGTNQSDAFAELMKEIRSAKETVGRKLNKKAADTSIVQSEERLLTVFFSEIDHVCRFCKHFMEFRFLRESLYKCAKEYALILDTSEIGKEEMAALFMQASEYGKFFTLGDLRAYEIEEHETCIIKEDALMYLQNL